MAKTGNSVLPIQCRFKLKRHLRRTLRRFNVDGTMSQNKRLIMEPFQIETSASQTETPGSLFGCVSPKRRASQNE
jgi:hypothetical protein